MAGLIGKSRIEIEDRNKRPVRFGTGQEDIDGTRFDTVNDPGKGYAQATDIQPDLSSDGGSTRELAHQADDR